MYHASITSGRALGTRIHDRSLQGVCVLMRETDTATIGDTVDVKVACVTRQDRQEGAADSGLPKALKKAGVLQEARTGRPKATEGATGKEAGNSVHVTKAREMAPWTVRREDMAREQDHAGYLGTSNQRTSSSWLLLPKIKRAHNLATTPVPPVYRGCEPVGSSLVGSNPAVIRGGIPRKVGIRKKRRVLCPRATTQVGAGSCPRLFKGEPPAEHEVRS